MKNNKHIAIGYSLVDENGLPSNFSSKNLGFVTPIKAQQYNDFFHIDEKEMLTLWLADKVLDALEGEEELWHSLEMDCYEMNFDGNYYFGGANGALVQENTVTTDGFIVDDTGKVINLDDLGIDNLKPQLENLLSGYQGTWSVYVKDLNEDKEFLINDTPLYSASLIKPFVMAKTYQDMEQVRTDEAKKLNTTDMKTVDVKLNDLLWNMITVSDNESCKIGRASCRERV